ncbi:unnamed protein product [Acanthoscelides obtectus]|uniref:Protoheme IX farnesyltransferase, mitochondrial n=1 Tax=Acanthoscelides obtectus TaxID=200917 RepID=A0A9P0JUM5_ACAOB|nr:unnamed protein product [Acanthoscelides obtectus]CAK1621145.1 Protoheme IX farnesyltransferase, mitochondrial [Acanthoscelides obtectus]
MFALKLHTNLAVLQPQKYVRCLPSINYYVNTKPSPPVVGTVNLDHEISNGSNASLPHKPKQVPAWRPTPSTDSSNLINHYLKLSKVRLTTLVVITSMAGYAVAPAPFEWSTFTLCALGTGLLSGAANSVNQFHEVPFDSQMSRTKNRVLVCGRLTPLHSMLFAAGTSITGLGILYYGVNGLTASLGLANLILYTSIYTPMKRISILNTWVGSIAYKFYEDASSSTSRKLFRFSLLHLPLMMILFLVNKKKWFVFEKTDDSEEQSL